MLISLHIENVAVIERTDIEFSDGLNVLTGETGAGKSIIIDSINAVTGERTSKDIIRTGEKKAKINATFLCNNAALDIISELGMSIEEDGIVMISRELSDDGRSTFRLNGQVVPASFVKQISPYLINIHGQHDSQQLFSPSNHINFIDNYGNMSDDLNEYHKYYKNLCEIRKTLFELNEDTELKQRKSELLSFQIDEITSADLKIGEEEELLQRREILLNSEKLSNSIRNIHEILSGNEDSDGVISMLKDITDYLGEISEYDDSFSDLYERAANSGYELEDILSRVREADGRFEYDQNEQNEIEERLDIIYKLKQKYGNSIEEILKKLDALNKEYDLISFSDKHKAELINKEKELFDICNRLAEKISVKRLEFADKLCKNILNELAFLDMPNVKFSISHETIDLKSNGFDQMEFLISPNAGEDLKPLSKIASGGELSRIMLAIKSVLSSSDVVETLIFDEIDTGVSGKTARKIGEKMRQISKDKQVICITHLAQIASLASNHLFIEKSTVNDKTFTSVKQLSYEERVKEVARIMGGEIISESTLKAAEELIQE